MENWTDVVEALIQVRTLRTAKAKAIQDWGVDIPNTVLFGAFGRSIACNFISLSLEEKRDVFETIELSMNSSDEAVKSLVATGLLEALYNSSRNDVLLWPQIMRDLGVSSRTYLAVWEASGV
jgi:hypothetical protein